LNGNEAKNEPDRIFKWRPGIKHTFEEGDKMKEEEAIASSSS
jgi:hypothetical protein